MSKSKQKGLIKKIKMNDIEIVCEDVIKKEKVDQYYNIIKCKNDWASGNCTEIDFEDDYSKFFKLDFIGGRIKKEIRDKIKEGYFNLLKETIRLTRKKQNNTTNKTNNSLINFSYRDKNDFDIDIICNKFAEIVKRIYKIEKDDAKLNHPQLERSFASKILHTINPELPIWDSTVEKMIKFQTKTAFESYDDNELLKSYKNLLGKYKEFFDTGVIVKNVVDKENIYVKDLLKCFNDKYDKNTYPLLTDTKKIDFILWQGAKLYK